MQPVQAITNLIGTADEEEVWIYPNSGLHTANFRGASTPQGSKSMIAVAMDVGEDQYLDEHGRYPALRVTHPPDVTSEEDITFPQILQ